MAIAALKAGFDTLYVPADNAPEATLCGGLNVIPVTDIRQLADHLSGCQIIPPQPEWKPADNPREYLDFKDVKGQLAAKQALEIAAAGGHNVLMVGPPGSGKSMLAKRLPSIMPAMSREEALEVTQIHSIMGMLDRNSPLVTTRPFRSPHHTVSMAGLAGGGSNPHPGEITLAHRGLLFLDELPEFRKETVEILRQPMEDGVVTISRASNTVTYPSDFVLVAAMNPCRCGWYGDENHKCTCSHREIIAYNNKISGPLRDRIDLTVEVLALSYDEMSGYPESESSAVVRARVEEAVERQRHRFAGTGIKCNAAMQSRELRQFCQLNDASQKVMRRAYERLRLTMRTYDKILKVSRTVADLDGSDDIQVEHIAQAVGFRESNFEYL